MKISKITTFIHSFIHICTMTATAEPRPGQVSPCVCSVYVGVGMFGMLGWFGLHWLYTVPKKKKT